MLMPEQVPDEVAKAVMHCFHTRNAAKSAIAAALNAWPDATSYGPHSSGHGPSRTQLVLPLPTENTNAEG